MNRGINCCRGDKAAHTSFESAGIQATGLIHLNSTAAKGVPSDLLKKRNLFQFRKVAEPRYYSLGDSYKKIPLGELKRRFSKARKILATCDLVLRYIKARVSQVV